MNHYIGWLNRNASWGIALSTLVAAVASHLVRPGCSSWAATNAEWLTATAVALATWAASAIRAAQAGEPIPDPPPLKLPESDAASRPEPPKAA